MNDIIEKDKKYIVGTYGRFPIEIVKGKGSVVWDNNGKEYIDLGSGIAVNSFGFCDEQWQEAIKKQISLFQHTSNLYYTAPCVKLAEMLCEKTGYKKVFFSNSGAEANECAIKTARKYSAEKKGKEYYNIITLKNSFHGRTITTLAATAQDSFHKTFLPLTDGFIYCPANDCEQLEKAVIENKISAIMFEPVQGEGGVLPLEKEFVLKMAEIAEKYDILLIADEVQTGNGRTGKYFGYMNFGIKPDIVSTAKGLAGGLPIGATLFGEKTQNVLKAGDHGSTFGGNPVSCAAAISIVERIDDDLLASVKEKSAYIFSQLNNAKGIKSVSGMGLMIGFETMGETAKIVAECRNNGVLVLTAKTKVRLLPALNIPMEELVKAIEIIKKVCAED